ncbi:hypothetical protein LTR15_008779 [Elasticomyces elasticus]|nr:hypothetical protein LTR15_008779 [Elasticomyces elasticus]
MSAKDEQRQATTRKIAQRPRKVTTRARDSTHQHEDMHLSTESVTSDMSADSGELVVRFFGDRFSICTQQDGKRIWVRITPWFPEAKSTQVRYGLYNASLDKFDRVNMQVLRDPRVDPGFTDFMNDPSLHKDGIRWDRYGFSSQELESLDDGQCHERVVKRTKLIKCVLTKLLEGRSGLSIRLTTNGFGDYLQAPDDVKQQAALQHLENLFTGTTPYLKDPDNRKRKKGNEGDDVESQSDEDSPSPEIDHNSVLPEIALRKRTEQESEEELTEPSGDAVGVLPATESSASASPDPSLSSQPLHHTLAPAPQTRDNSAGLTTSYTSNSDDDLVSISHTDFLNAKVKRDIKVEQACLEQARLEEARLEEARLEEARLEEARLEEARQMVKTEDDEKKDVKVDRDTLVGEAGSISTSSEPARKRMRTEEDREKEVTVNYDSPESEAGPTTSSEQIANDRAKRLELLELDEQEAEAEEAQAAARQRRIRARRQILEL